MRHQALTCIFRGRGRARARLLVTVGLALGGSGCSDPGEMILVVQTDMAIPKDIDKIHLTVQSEGTSFLDVTYPDGFFEELRLPGTLGITGDPGQPITVRAAGLKDGEIRVEREIQTEVPDVRGSMLRVPLHWLCDRALLEEAYGITECPSGQTCIAGECASSVVDSSVLPLFSEAEVFGGGSGSGADGSCFDTNECFDGFVFWSVQPWFEFDYMDNPRKCVFQAADLREPINVALRTEADGICGPFGCFVPLDHGTRDGFKVENVVDSQLVHLPPALCDHAHPGKVLDFHISTLCAPKTERTPACGTWSLAGTSDGPDPSIPMTLADGQQHPTEIVVARERVCWINAGTEGPSSGEIKCAPIGGGASLEGFSKVSPVGLATDQNGTIFWINAVVGAALLEWWPDTNQLKKRFDWPDARTGLAMNPNDFYSRSLDGGILYATYIHAVGQVAADQGDSRGIAADATGVYWTNREKGMVMHRSREDGVTTVVSSGESNPTVIVADGPSVYWINEGTPPKYLDGTVMKGNMDGSPSKAIAEDQQQPQAIAADASNIYWTTRGGRVMKVAKSGGNLEILASNEYLKDIVVPTAIAVDDTSVYWANAGSGANNFRDGSIMKVAKNR